MITNYLFSLLQHTSNVRDNPRSKNSSNRRNSLQIQVIRHYQWSFQLHDCDYSYVEAVSLANVQYQHKHLPIHVAPWNFLPSLFAIQELFSLLVMMAETMKHLYSSQQTWPHEIPIQLFPTQTIAQHRHIFQCIACVFLYYYYYYRKYRFI